MKIGVFDSGLGGQAVADELARLLPTAEIISINDHEHVPYGGRSQQEIIRLTTQAIRPLVDQACDAIVIACNTATTNAISELRATFPLQHFIGLEPMVKPAAHITKTGAIAVLATPATLASHRYNELKQQWAAAITVLEPDCADWALFIEQGRADEIDIEAAITDVREHGADVIVLACTHYHLIKERIHALAPSVTILEPTTAIKNRIVEITQSTQPPTASPQPRIDRRDQHNS